MERLRYKYNVKEDHSLSLIDKPYFLLLFLLLR